MGKRATRRRWWWIAGLGVSLSVGGLALESGRLSAEPPPKLAPVRVTGPETVVALPWGDGPSAVGRKELDQGASEGPMSFAVDELGQTFVLDQVHGRVLRMRADGAVTGEVAIPADSFQDLEVVQGSLVLLDRLARRSLVVIAPGGALVVETPIEGDGIPEGGGVTAMFADDAGVWLEFDHTDRVRVLDADLHPCKREILRGRAFLPGERLMAALHTEGRARVWVEDAVTGNTLRSIVVAPEHAVARIAWLQADRSGAVHAVFHLLEFDPAEPARVVHEDMLGVRYDQELRETATWRSPWVIRRWEQFREFRVLPDGTVYQMGFDDKGVSVLRWSWPS